MKDVDFLPAGFRRQYAKRHTHLWRAAVIGLFALLMAGTILLQGHRRNELWDALATTRRIHEETQVQVNQLGRLQVEQTAAEHEARLVAYLLHPWPRTRILAAVLNPLPDEIALDRLTIAQTASTDALPPAVSVVVNPNADEGRPTPRTPAARDLERLRKEIDATQTRVTLSGETTKPEALHGYLDKLSRSPLVAKADLDSLESAEKGRSNEAAAEGPMRFSATIVIRPGYGQPGGPTSPTEQAADTTAPATPPTPRGQI